MIATATLPWFARHELQLAWRDWAQMMAGGKSRREKVVAAVACLFVVLMHAFAYAALKPVIGQIDLSATSTLIMLGAGVLLAFSMMLSQAIEQVTRAFYARADIDLIMSSPASPAHLFAVRIAAVAVTGAAMTGLMAAPFINVAAIIDGPRWLSAYAVIAATSALATAVATAMTVAMFRCLGARRTRRVAQVFAAIVGAGLLIGLQAAGVVLYGNLSRISVLSSPWIAAAVPAPSSWAWLPVFALAGDPAALIVVIALALLALTITGLWAAPQFATHAIATAGADEAPATVKVPGKAFKPRSTAAALRRKEWQLLARDPWLMSQTLMQLLYLIPPALLLWRDMGNLAGSHVLLAPVLVMAFGQLSGGLAWLAISGEDAPDFITSAPITAKDVLRAKIEAVLAIVVAVATPLILFVALNSPAGALATLAGIMAASASSIAIQLWFKATAKRRLFGRRQTASRAATFAEAFSSIFWAGAAGLAAAQSYFALLFVMFALVTLLFARYLSPAGADAAN